MHVYGTAVIVGQQAGDVISQHGGHDIGVMDLFAACLKISHQFDELPGDSSRIVRDFKPLDKLCCLRKHCFSGQV